MQQETRSAKKVPQNVNRLLTCRSNDRSCRRILSLSLCFNSSLFHNSLRFTVLSLFAPGFTVFLLRARVCRFTFLSLPILFSLSLQSFPFLPLCSRNEVRVLPSPNVRLGFCFPCFQCQRRRLPIFVFVTPSCCVYLCVLCRCILLVYLPVLTVHHLVVVAVVFSPIPCLSSIP